MESTTSRSEFDDERWFHGKITSQEANDILKREGGEDGLFLIRESHSSPGNYVLSFINENQPLHLLIRKYKEDAFFSLVLSESEPPIIHGLDNLVSHYYHHPVGVSRTTLHKFCPGEAPPHEVRLHGSSNLLHRSTSQGNLIVVSELLKSGYRKLDVKDSNGQTALHIACMKGNDDIVKMLLNAQAGVQARDQEGLTALHHACRYNRGNIVKLLIELGKADIQARATKSGDVALHEAAACGSLSCIKTLLGPGIYAPSAPRNIHLQTPADIAKQNGHMDCYTAIANHVGPAQRYSLHDYYHGQISRNIAQERLIDRIGVQSGDFLVRQSNRKGESVVLSMVYIENNQKEIKNFEISHEGEFLCIDDGPYFPTLDALLDHYIRLVDGLPCRLHSPVRPQVPVPAAELPFAPYKRRTSCSSIQSPKHDHLFGGFSMPNIQSSCANSSSPRSAEAHPKLGRRPEPLPSVRAADNLNIGPRHSSSSSRLSPNPLSDASSYDPLMRTQSQETLLSQSELQLNEEHPGMMSQDTLINFDASMNAGNLNHESSRQNNDTPPPRPDRAPLNLELNKINHLSINNNNENCGASPTMVGNRTEEIFGSISKDSLQVGRTLGTGEFGSVLEGLWVCPSGDKIDVAVKTLNDNDNSKSKVNSFMREADIMMNLNHPHIVKLLGVCHGPPIAMVQELVAMGALLDYLLDHQDEVTVEFHLKLYAAQIADGMCYLEHKGFVHRDLAARNILLSSLTMVKISDFGLSRAVGVGKDYYTASEGGKWPLKWYAPESINYGTFTHASDIWSYGVTLWECYTYGDQPYGDFPGHKVIEMLEKGQRLPQPKHCPKGVYDLMLRCWNVKPTLRPSFKELALIFKTKPEYVNIKPYFK